MLRVFKPKALATLTDEGRTLATLDEAAKVATGAMLVVRAAAAIAGRWRRASTLSVCVLQREDGRVPWRWLWGCLYDEATQSRDCTRNQDHMLFTFQFLECTKGIDSVCFWCSDGFRMSGFGGQRARGWCGPMGEFTASSSYRVRRLAVWRSHAVHRHLTPSRPRSSRDPSRPVSL
jgi:hypothetical protein